MLLRFLPTLALLAAATSQEAPNSEAKVEPKKLEEPKPVVLLATPLNQSEQPQKPQEVPLEVKQFYARQQVAPDLYGLTYLQPDYHQSVQRLQPQIVLYGPGGQGQPILINPGNPPGNFLIPQGPGPNVIVRNSPQAPGFPVAGYPKPAHIPPIEKDAEEIPTNPAQVPPLETSAGPTTKPRAKPEKLETFTEQNQPDQGNGAGQFPQYSPESVSLRPGQRFFVLNGDNIYNYPFEAQPQIPNELPAFRYTNVQPFPQNPPKYLQAFAQEPPQFLQSNEGPSANEAPISVPNLLLRNSFVSSQQPPQPQQVESQPTPENDGALKTAQQYFRTGLAPNHATFVDGPLEYQGFFLQPRPLNRQVQGLEGKSDIVQPQLVGQFRFTPESAPGFYQFRDDVENDAVVVDASFDAPIGFDGSAGNVKADDSSSSTSNPQPAEKPVEPSMAQAGPQATAIAGPGGVAGSAPRGTAIVGKGGLAVSSPQATAVAGTKDEEKKKRPVKKEI